MHKDSKRKNGSREIYICSSTRSRETPIFLGLDYKHLRAKHLYQASTVDTFPTLLSIYFPKAIPLPPVLQPGQLPTPLSPNQTTSPHSPSHDTFRYTQPETSFFP